MPGFRLAIDVTKALCTKTLSLLHVDYGAMAKLGKVC